jgi:hypothetical protein
MVKMMLTSECDLGTPDTGGDDPEASVPDADDSASMLSDFTIDEALLDDQFEGEASLDAALTSEQLDVDAQEEELLLPEGFMAEESLAEQPVASEDLNDEPVVDELSENISADDFLTDELEDKDAELLHAKDDIARVTIPLSCPGNMQRQMSTIRLIHYLILPLRPLPWMMKNRILVLSQFLLLRKMKSQMSHMFRLC